MASAVWPRLRRLLRTPEYFWAVWVFGILAGLVVPLLLIMVGWLIELLLLGQIKLAAGQEIAIPQYLSLGELFELPTSLLNSGGSILRGVLGLIVLITIVVVLECIALLISYRAALHSSLELAIDVQRKLFEKSSTLAIEKGLSGQKEAIGDMMFIHVPQIREALSQWYRVFPRHPIQSFVLLCLAASIQPAVTLLALIGGAFAWYLYNYLDSFRRKRRPVLYERARATSEQLAYLCETAPLLASVHDQRDTQHSFESQLDSYRKTQMQLSDGGIWKSPPMLLFSTLMTSFLLVVVSIRFLDDASELHFGELFTLFASVTLAIAGIQRFMKSFRRYKTSEAAAYHLAAYLEQPTLVNVGPEQNKQLVSLKNISLEHVTLKNSSGEKLLENVSASIQSGNLTAIIASEPVQASAFAELLLGFGRPASGRILFDGVDSTDLEPLFLRNSSLWVSAKGPLIQGSLEENLWAGVAPDATIDLVSFAKRMHVADAILNLPDSLSTLVSPNDDRIQPDDLFRLGLTRGLIKKPKLIFAEEPTSRVNQETEMDSSEALLQLRGTNTTLIVLSNRLATLRNADQIIVLHEHKIAGIGTHSELLQTCEIYRHINYLRFSPFAD